MQQGHEFIYLAKKLRDAQTYKDESYRSKKHQTKLKKIETEFDEYLAILLDPEKFKKRFP
tara:strand:- start:715 stop:894 length:180 start_codon:yes stop_codon:yes gene_type:complete